MFPICDDKKGSSDQNANISFPRIITFYFLKSKSSYKQSDHHWVLWSWYGDEVGVRAGGVIKLHKMYNFEYTKSTKQQFLCHYIVFSGLRLNNLKPIDIVEYTFFMYYVECPNWDIWIALMRLRHESIITGINN